MTDTTEAKLAEIRERLRNSDDRNLVPLADILSDRQVDILRDAFKGL